MFDIANSYRVYLLTGQWSWDASSVLDFSYCTCCQFLIHFASFNTWQCNCLCIWWHYCSGHGKEHSFTQDCLLTLQLCMQWCHNFVLMYYTFLLMQKGGNFSFNFTFQCFDTACWASGRACGPKIWEMRCISENKVKWHKLYKFYSIATKSVHLHTFRDAWFFSNFPVLVTCMKKIHTELILLSMCDMA